MPQAYTAQRGRDFIVKIGSSILECTDKTLNDARTTVDITTDYFLQQTGTRDEQPLDREIDLNLSIPIPAYNETNTAYDAVKSAYDANTQLTGATAVVLTFAEADTGTSYNGRVKQFNIPGPATEFSIADVVIRLTVVAGS